MTNWPDKPLIRIIRGAEYEEPIDGSLAVREDPGGEYFLVSGPRAKNTVDPTCTLTDSIDEWEEVTFVPTAHLKELKEAWHGDGEYTPTGLKTLGDAMGPVLSCLPDDEPGALDQAVTRVKDIGGRMIDAKSTQEERLSLLLDALATVQSAARKTAPLTMVARICADWASLENPHSDGLAAIRSRAEGNPVRADFIVLSSFIGDISKSLDDGMSDGPRGDLIEMGWYALAWAAQTIEEEDR
jgi:hypothetical protein